MCPGLQGRARGEHGLAGSGWPGAPTHPGTGAQVKFPQTADPAARTEEVQGIDKEAVPVEGPTPANMLTGGNGGGKNRRYQTPMGDMQGGPQPSHPWWGHGGGNNLPPKKRLAAQEPTADDRVRGRGGIT